ncbi:MAG: ATP-binding cassette domain-containing protein, partial [Planctomycetes bacterium]|nr:ATP-binding cassette domain-containing protein [Planctomycetota bacterium]
MNAIIETNSLRRSFRVRQAGGGLRRYLKPRYNELVALHGLDLRIQKGERVAFVGPNGAGKSTTIKILCGVLYPSSGQASVCGLTPWASRRALAYKIGVVFGQRSQLWYHLPAQASFDLLAKVYELDRGVYRKRVAELSERFQIGEFATRPVRQLSLGQRMRCEIVASLLHQPEVIFLDEPTIGLDVTAKAIIRDLVRELSEELGTTVLLTSHDTGD